MFEKAGRMRIKMCEQTFYLIVDLIVPEEYPAKKAEMKFIEHNYDKNFSKIFEAGAD